MLERVTMALYSLLLACVLVVGWPYWLWRLARGGPGWKTSLAARLGRVPDTLRATAGRQVVWVHAVSVGEVLAAMQLVAGLEQTLGDGWRIVVSTTTATGQALARQRLGERKDFSAEAGGRVFWYPLDFAWAVRAYLRALRPRMLVLMESELWPRMLVECRRAGVPVAVANARVSDRSFERGMRVQRIWSRLLRKVTLFLAQSEEDARRLAAMGARASAVRVVGNLKYDAAEPVRSEIVKRLDAMRPAKRIVIAGSTLEGEEQPVLAAWAAVRKAAPDALLVIAPRHPQRFGDVAGLIAASGYTTVLASQLLGTRGEIEPGAVVLLNTIGDLAAAYGVAEVAFVGGSLVPRGGHNPLEPARFGVPVVLGPSYENFREIVGEMKSADAIRIVKDADGLRSVLTGMLIARDEARDMGERGRRVFEEERGAIARTVGALVELIRSGGLSGRNATAMPEAGR